MTKQFINRLRALLPLFAGLCSAAQAQYNLQTPASPVASGVHSLNTEILLVCTVIFCGVFGVMFYALFKHRKSIGHKPAQFHESTLIEVLWTVIPFFVLIAIAIPATKLVLAQKDTTNADITIKVTGYQWKWGYDYLGEGFGFLSNLSTPIAQIRNTETKGENYLLEVDNPMVVPVGKKIRLLVTANDVIHSWAIPAFAVKQDGIPGFIRYTQFIATAPGIYRGQCSELCGKEHGFMPIVVEVKSQADYDAWVVDQKKKFAAKQDDPSKVWDMPGLMARGEKVFNGNCAACHQTTGKGVPGAFPALDGSAIVTGTKSGQMEILLKGKNNKMPAWASLSDTDLAAAMTYTRNSWGNHTGQIIQPSDFKTYRDTGKVADDGAPAAAGAKTAQVAKP